ncbi:MAG: hypothetical protein IPG95_15910 [Saprospiraceae bacterium]|nr:hypothetical protein [Saprospiraceae bacterium]
MDIQQTQSMFSISFWNDLNQWNLEHVLDWVVWVEYHLSQSPQRQCTLRNTELISSSFVFLLCDLCVKISYHKVHRENTHGEIQS